MCGYTCCGCGSCGKPRTIPLPPVKCLNCGTLFDMDKGLCPGCGAEFLPPGQKKKAEA